MMCTHRGKHHRGQLVILDAFCGVGGNTIAFARCAGVYVMAYDNDKTRLDLASHNTAVYGVHDTVNFVHDDVIAVLTTAASGTAAAANGNRQTSPLGNHVDMIFLSPPWGGPEYMDLDTFDLRSSVLVSGLDILDLVELALAITPNVACFLPRNADLRPFVSMFANSKIISKRGHLTLPMEIEKNYLNGKLKAITLYFGQLAESMTRVC
jgi:trimethylguanosine synthase